MARTAALLPGMREAMARVLAGQIESFVKDNPYGCGIHWVSGQEIAIRVFAWLFGISVLGGESAIDSVVPLAADCMHEAGCHIQHYINYARRSVYNNHLIAEGLGLLTLGCVLPNAPEADSWRREGEALLDECAVRQFKSDGAYIQNSHNYHRAALLLYLWGTALMRHIGRPLPSSWRLAMELSVDFLHAHQNPQDGRLPNYGANDGALPFVLSTCDFSDFRPVLQAVSVAARGERLYPPGPWDEVAAWISTPAAVESAPLRPIERVSVSFPGSGYHVLRGKDPSTFAAFRCGDITERFSQIDMLALDVWWRGQNVIADAGSYLYNGPARWHDHFSRTSGHSTVQVDGIDQMLHHRRFKVLYWTKARLLRFEDEPSWCLAEGEHHGFERSLPGCVHRRAVLLLKDRECVVVVDTVQGAGEHEVKLQWLAGTAEYAFDPSNCLLRLNTPVGPFFVKVVDGQARPAGADVACGRQSPPRGWLSRYYGEKLAVPSLHAGGRLHLPATLVTVLSPAKPLISTRDGSWLVHVGGQPFAFTLRDGRFDSIALAEEIRVQVVAAQS
jgi:asparagine synthase (glutamine-hydrolysing)